MARQAIAPRRRPAAAAQRSASSLSDAAGLTVLLESPLLDSLPVGRATAIYCAGRCWHRSQQVAALEIAVDGARHPVRIARMPRPDVYAELHGPGWRAPTSPDDPEGRSYRSGFWVTIPIPARPRPGSVELRAVARLQGGAEVTAPLGAVRVDEQHPPPPCPDVPACSEHGLIAICMATFEPDEALFRAQVDSIRRQTDDRWVCVISDDGSTPKSVEPIRDAVGDDPRFLVSRAPERLGYYRNFERALAMAPAEAQLIALSDQDDRWHPDKLALLRDALGGAGLAYSDQRLVRPDGRVLSDTMWRGRRNNYTNMASMLIANTITGAASLMRREIADLALPFPLTPGLQFHDHWIAVVALAAGDVAYVDRPLSDYVQHPGAVLGRGGNDDGGGGGIWGRLAALRGGEFDRWRQRYYFGYLAREIQARAALARCDGRLAPAKRRALGRYVNAQHSLAGLLWLAARGPLRTLAGRNETKRTEWELVQGILWRRLVAARARRDPWSGGRGLDAGYPPLDATGFEQRGLRRWRASLRQD
jgi:glycosyltransferase involved in cell wall biosynthesis